MSRGGWGERAVYVGDIEGTAQLQAEAGGTTVQCAQRKLRLRGTLGPMVAAGPREAAVQGHHSVQGHHKGAVEHARDFNHRYNYHCNI